MDDCLFAPTTQAMDSGASGPQLIAYCRKPFDVRTAAIAWGISPSTDASSAVVKKCRDSGAPIVILSVRENIEIWRQGSDSPVLKETLPARRFPEYLSTHKKALSPQAVYRAKNLGQINPQSYQMEFVDAGLMPLLERHVGDRLGRLLTSVVAETLPEWKRVQGETAQDNDLLLKSVFRLLAGKILRDKAVPGFKSLGAVSPENILQHVTRHCGGEPDEKAFRRGAWHVLSEASQRIFGLSSLCDMSTESLGVIYESAFISKDTRRKLGTHSTPPWLADYMMWQVEDWFREISSEERFVYEPACGHGAFLVAALRMLQQFAFEESLPYGETAKYVRNMLHGADIDTFSLEIARLSLSLTDIPNPNGWKLYSMNLLTDDPFSQQVPSPSLVLTNPPYEAFAAQERSMWACSYYTKYAEMLARTLPHIRENGILGFIAPSGFLTRNTEAHIRKKLTTEFEIKEIDQFPDDIFKFSDAETCVLLARRKKPHIYCKTRFNHLSESGMEVFRKRYQFETTQEAEIAAIAQTPDYCLYLPLLNKLWKSLAHHPTLKEVAEVGRGIEFQKGCPVTRSGRSRDILRHVDSGRLHHQEPRSEKLVFSGEDVRFWGTAAQAGTPQIVVNAARVSRGPWKICALMDRRGLLTTKRWITIRLRREGQLISLELLWAILTSPLGNAFIHAKSGKRDIDTKTYEAIPLPCLRDPRDCVPVEQAVKTYVSRALEADKLAMQTSEDELKSLRLQVDAKVLNLYDLAPRDERMLLDLFTGYKRLGVPFEQTEYFSSDFLPFVPLHEYLSPAFKRSTAGEIRKIDFEKMLSPRMKEALRHAVELYADEE
jgi:type I restriction-modification system DNA methylase subunit